MQLRLNDVEKLVEMVSRSQVSEVTVEEGTRRVTVRKASFAPAPAHIASDDTPVRAVDTSPSAGTPPDAAMATDEALVTAPMVGVFRHSERPVAVGRSIVHGQIVGAIESMKLMNDVRAESAGVVSEVLIEDGSPVEYGQPLFVLQGDEDHST
jgi:acetyl-CoA carboxylase biotin carboxyl carrier protein